MADTLHPGRGSERGSYLRAGRGLAIDRSLQHSELSVVDQHAAYTDFLNTGDDLVNCHKAAFGALN